MGSIISLPNSHRFVTSWYERFQSIQMMLMCCTESSLNPAAEAFRNFDADPPNNMISSLTLDSNEDARRAAASRANSVRFDESANNHYGPSRASIELPTRTGSGLGSHPLSERSLSHRSERGSTSGFGRTNSFGLESSRLLGSIHNSPRVSGNPPPGFFVLGPCPSVIRCWLTETFSNGSLLYAALCTGASQSSISLSLLQRLGLTDSIIEENGLRKVRLLVYLTEAKLHLPSSRSASPAPQVPTVTAKFLLYDNQSPDDKSIQIFLGSDVLREHTADILFSQDKVMLFDDDRNQLSIPLVRPEDDAVYKNLITGPRSRRVSTSLQAVTPADTLSEQSAPGIIGRPSRPNVASGPVSPTSEATYMMPPPTLGDGNARKVGQLDTSVTYSNEVSQLRSGDDSKSTTGSEKSAGTPSVPKAASGVWSGSWRSNAAGDVSGPSPTGMGTWSKSSVAARPMKVLRPGRSMASNSRTTSLTSPAATGPDSNPEGVRTSFGSDQPQTPSSATDSKTPATKSNPVGGASAFGWLNSGNPRKTSTNGSK